MIYEQTKGQYSGCGNFKVYSVWVELSMTPWGNILSLLLSAEPLLAWTERRLAFNSNTVGVVIGPLVAEQFL